MPTSVLTASGAATVSGTLTYTGGAGNHTVLSDSSDATLANLSGASANVLWPMLTGVPTDIATVTGISISLRLARAAKGDVKNITSVQLFRADGTTAISASAAVSTQTASAATYTVTPSVSLSSQAAWNEVRIKLLSDSGTAIARIFEISITITYTAAVTEQYAVKTGNWNDTTVWSTGAVPTTGPVYSNGYTVTVNVNSAATSVSNLAGTVAVAGGSFVLSNGVTLTANVLAGATTCVTLATGVSATVIGNSYGGSLSNTYGISKTGTGTLTQTGHAYGGTGSHGTINLGSGTVAISGNCYGSDTNSSAYGARNASSGTLTVGGSVYAGAAAPGLALVSTGTTSVAGSVYAAGSVVGMLHGGSTNNVTISGNAVGGTTVLAFGVQCTSSGNVTITGAAISPASPGVGAGVGVTGTGYAVVGSAQTGTGGGSPCIGHVHVADLSAATVSVRSASDVVTLATEVDLPSPFQPSPVFGAA